MLLLVFLPLSVAQAQKGVIIDNLVYNLYPGTRTAQVASGSDYSIEYAGDVVVPATVNHQGRTYNVTSIGRGAFLQCHQLTSVTLPDGLTTLDYFAFMDCTNLTTLRIPESVENILYLSLNCPLTDFNLPNSLVLLSNSVWTNTQWYKTHDDGPLYKDGRLLGWKGELPADIIINEGTIGVEDLDSYARNCTSVYSIQLPQSLKYLMADFRSFTNVSEIVLPNGLKKLWGSNFYQCNNLTAISLPDSLTLIGSSVFKECHNISTPIIIPNGVTYIGKEAFAECSGIISSTFTIPESVTTIGLNAFVDTPWYNDQPDGLLYKDGWLLGYKGAPLTGDVVIEPGTKHIADNAFRSCSGITSVTLPDGLETIGAEAFESLSNLTSITFPDGLKTIGDRAFFTYTSSSIKFLHIPSSVTYIGDQAFGRCNNLLSVIIDSVSAYFGEEVFSGCTKINNVFCYADPENLVWLDHAMNDFMSKKKTLFYVNDVDAWSDYFDANFTIVDLQDNTNGTCGAAGHENDVTWNFNPYTNTLTISGTGAMPDYDEEDPHPWNRLRNEALSLVVEDGITYIGDYAFTALWNLSYVSVSNSVEYIGELGLEETQWFQNQPDGLIYLGNILYQYKGGADNVHITIKDGTLGIAGNAFDGGRIKMSSLILPASLRTIGPYSFYHCDIMTSVTIPANVYLINRDAFNCCRSTSDVYCYADPDILEWIDSNDHIYSSNRYDDFIGTFNPHKETLCHVLPNKLSTFNAKWNTGNMETDVNVTFVGDLDTYPISITDNCDNNSLMGSLNGNTNLTITLSSRTLYKDGAWNTLCLPFDVSTSNGVLSGDGVTAMVLNTATSGLSGGTLTLNFIPAPATIPAGTPFIIKWTSGTDIQNPQFTGVSVTAPNPTACEFTGGRFVGTYSEFAIDDSNIDDIIYLGSANTIGYASTARTLRGFRAHFEVPTGGNRAPVRNIVLDFGGTTLVDPVTEGLSDTSDDGEWYTIYGAPLNGKPAAKGLYIHNGNKVIVK